MATMNTTATAIHRNSRPPRVKAPGLAIDVAVLMFRQPNSFVVARQSPLPHGIIDVMKAAAGDDETLQKFADSKGMVADIVKQAAQFYLRQVLTSAGNDPHRKLALDRGALPAVIRDHKRWLLKWLHPDRNPNKWESILFAQVSEAALKLEQVGAGASPVVTLTASQRAAKSRPQRYRPVTRSKRAVVVSVLKYVAFVMAVAALTLTAVESGIYQNAVNFVFSMLF